MTPFVIGLDLDAVILDTHSAWRDYMDSKRVAHGHRELSMWPYPTWEYPKELCHKCFNVCLSSRLLSRTSFIPGALEGIESLHRGGHTLRLISGRRPAHLERVREAFDGAGVGGMFASFDFGQYDKVPLCRHYGVDILLDDSPRVLASMHEPGSRTTGVAFAYPYNAHHPIRVISWERFVRNVAMWQEFS